MDDPDSFSIVLNFTHTLATLNIADWSYIVGLISLMLVLLACSGFISASEIALFSLEKQDLEAIASEHPVKSEELNAILEEPDRLLATILIVNNTVNIGLVLLSTLVFDVFQGQVLFPEWVMILTQVVGVTLLILLFGEIVPKVYATQKNQVVAMVMVRPIMLFNKLFKLPSMLLVGLSNTFDAKIKRESTNLSIDELSEVHDIVQTKASKQEQKMLDGILEIGQIEAKQSMVSRTDMVAISCDISFKEVLEIINNETVSRIPVYQETIDNIIGVLYIKDLIEYLHQDVTDLDWLKLLRQPYFVPETKKLDDLLTEFQSKKIHLALVVDEYGGVEGLITMEDVIEEIVGDIRDEFDEEQEEDYILLEDGSYLFDGKLLLLAMYRVLDVAGEDFEEIKGESETIAGMLLEVKGGFPKKGEVIKLDNYKFTIEEVDKKRIKKIKLQVL